jgi:hypothetical protein
MDITSSNAQPSEENNETSGGSPLDPSWEKWRNDQVQTISNILSNVFKVEDEVRQMQAPSRLLRNPARQSGDKEEEICEKLKAIRHQISEYEHVLQLSLKRIDTALKVIHPSEPEKLVAAAPKKISTFESLKKWVKHTLKKFQKKKTHPHS